MLAAPESFSIELRDGSGGSRNVPLTSKPLTIGRDPASDVVLNDGQASWSHATVELDTRGFRITDLGSTNGTKVNGRDVVPFEPMAVGPGAVVVIGSSELRAVSSSGTQSVKLEGGRSTSFLIGRGSDCSVQLDDPTTSWHHASVELVGGRWRVRDLRSRNGTFVNGVAINEAWIGPSDRIRIGRDTFAIQGGVLSTQRQDRSVRLEAQQVGFTIDQAGRKMRLLDDVSFAIEPGELVAILGPSGAGKTTLLLALAGLQPANEGRVLLNGIDAYEWPETFRTTMGFVPQSEILHLDLPLESALRYAARLRLPSDTTRGEIERLVSETLANLELTTRRQTAIKSLSGGERKRANIAVELLTRPSLLFLDEPTTGLDASLDRKITRLMRKLADGGTTVITVTHSHDSVDLYDKVLVLAPGGRPKFYGTPSKALSHFGVRTFAEMYEVLEGRGDRDSSNARSRGPTRSDRHRAVRVSFAEGKRQYGALVSRSLELLWSDRRNLSFLVLQSPLMALAIMAIYSANVFSSSQSADSAGHLPIQDAPTLLFLMAVSVACFGLFSGARELVKERRIFDREHHVGLSLSAYLLSKLTVLGGIALVQCALLVALVGTKIDFHAPGNGTMIMFLLLFFGTLNATIQGLFVSAHSKTADQAITISAIVLLGHIVLSGLIPLERLGVLRPFAAICSTRWAYGATAQSLDLPAKLANLGLGPQAHEALKTDPALATFTLAFLAVLTFLAIGITMRYRRQRDVR